MSSTPTSNPRIWYRYRFATAHLIYEAVAIAFSKMTPLLPLPLTSHRRILLHLRNGYTPMAVSRTTPWLMISALLMSGWVHPSSIPCAHRRQTTPFVGANARNDWVNVQLKATTNRKKSLLCDVIGT